MTPKAHVLRKCSFKDAFATFCTYCMSRLRTASKLYYSHRTAGRTPDRIATHCAYIMLKIMYAQCAYIMLKIMEESASKFVIINSWTTLSQIIKNVRFVGKHLYAWLYM